MMFLGELEEVLELTDMAEFQKCMVPLFRRIASCLNSSHFQVIFFLKSSNPWLMCSLELCLLCVFCCALLLITIGMVTNTNRKYMLV